MAKKITLIECDEFWGKFDSVEEAVEKLKENLHPYDMYECETCGLQFNSEDDACTCCNEEYHISMLRVVQAAYDKQEGGQHSPSLRGAVLRARRRLELCRERIAKAKEKTNEQNS